MQINVRMDQNLLIVSVEGRMDTVSAPEFQQRMEELLDREGKGILMDFEKLEYVSSAGLRSILIAAKKAKSLGGQVSCCSLQDMVRKVFDVSGFTGMLPVYDSLEDALNR
ncbi:MAG: STAS domain-containing protein [Desulfomonilaceae bacterium]